MDSRWYFEFNLLPQSVSSIYFLDPSNSCSMNCIGVFYSCKGRVDPLHFTWNQNFWISFLSCYVFIGLLECVSVVSFGKFSDEVLSEDGNPNKINRALKLAMGYAPFASCLDY